MTDSKHDNSNGPVADQPDGLSSAHAGLDPKTQRVLLRTGVELEFAQEGSGEALVMIMGVRTQLIHWPAGFCAALHDEGFETLRFDNRDMGRSSKLRQLGKPGLAKTLWRGVTGSRGPVPYTLIDMAEDVAALMDSLQWKSANVCGISMGGMIAQELALRHPQRIRSLTLLMTSLGGVYWPTLKALRALLSPPGAGREQAGERLAEVFSVLAGEQVPMTSIEREATRALGSRAWERDPDSRGEEFMRQFAAIIDAPPRRQRLARLELPTMVVHGSADPLIPIKAGRDLAAAIPKARFEVIEGMGHFLPQAKWQPIARLIADHASKAGAEAATLNSSLSSSNS